MDRGRIDSELREIIDSAEPRRRAKQQHITVNGSGRTVVVNGDVHIAGGRRPRASAPPPAPDPLAHRARAGSANRWHEELETQIFARAAELRLTTDQFFNLASIKLGKNVDSLTDLSERDLGKLYEIVIALRRPALSAK